MIEPRYAINCLKLGFERYKRYSKLPIEIKVSNSTASFYVKKPDEGKGKNARVSNHHPNLQNYADRSNTPWLMDNVSIEFIVPDSEADLKRYRARVRQNAEGSIKPFDVTTYQYDPTLIEPNDMYAIFQAIMRFLSGEGYKDPFNGTPKKAKVIPRHSNIKPYRGKPTTESTNKVLSDKYLNEMTYLCIGDYVSILESKNNQNICNTNIKTENRNRNVVRLTESKLKIIIRECIKMALNESYSIRRLGCFDVVKGDNQPHSIKGLEQYGNALYDARLYSNVNDKKETFAIFSIGKNTSKYICCRLEFDEEYGTWLGFTPIKNYDVPTMIKQDLKNNPINQ